MIRLGLMVLVMSASLGWAQTNLPGPAAELFRKAQSGKFFNVATRLGPDVLPTSDGRSFFTVWRAASTNAPRHWIVSLPGRAGFAPDDLAIWSPHLRGRNVGLVSLQWWIGPGDDRASYYSPEEIYREIDVALRTVGAAPGRVMLHGFSRGAANAYAVAALDAGRGRRYFALNVASSGAVALDYPPNQALLRGLYGEHPLRGTRWVTAAGARDTERDGIDAMRRTARWLKEQGAIVVDSIEDPAFGHGALVINPRNARRVLDLFLSR